MKPLNTAIRNAIPRGTGADEPAPSSRCKDCGDSGQVLTSGDRGRTYVAKCACSVGASIVSNAKPAAHAMGSVRKWIKDGRSRCWSITGDPQIALSTAREIIRAMSGHRRYVNIMDRCPESQKSDSFRTWRSLMSSIANADVTVIGPDIEMLRWEQVNQLALLLRAIRGRDGSVAILVAGGKLPDDPKRDPEWWGYVRREITRLGYEGVTV